MNVIYENRQIENERLELSGKENLFWLTKNLVLRRCHLIIRVPTKRLIINRATFVDCMIDIKQELVNFTWVRASLKGCRFTGRITGSDFGYFPGYAPGGEQGSIEDCDFTDARLDACRFHCCPVQTLKFPSWPCFTILDPIGRSEELKSVEWPGIFGPVVINKLDTKPYTTEALTYYAPTLAKEMETTPEALKAVIEKFDCFVY